MKEETTMLSQAQIDSYHENGYVIPDFRIPESVLQAIDDHTAKLIETRPEFRDNCSALLRQDMGFAQYCEPLGFWTWWHSLLAPTSRFGT